MNVNQVSPYSKVPSNLNTKSIISSQITSLTVTPSDGIIPSDRILRLCNSLVDSFVNLPRLLDLDDTLGNGIANIEEKIEYYVYKWVSIYATMNGGTPPVTVDQLINFINQKFEGVLSNLGDIINKLNDNNANMYLENIIDRNSVAKNKINYNFTEIKKAWRKEFICTDSDSKHEQIMKLKSLMKYSNIGDCEIFSMIKELGNKGSSKLTRSQIYAWVVVYLHFYDDSSQLKTLDINGLSDFVNVTFSRFNNDKALNIKGGDKYFNEITNYLLDDKKNNFTKSWFNGSSLFNSQKYNLTELLNKEIDNIFVFKDNKGKNFGIKTPLSIEINKDEKTNPRMYKHNKVISIQGNKKKAPEEEKIITEFLYQRYVPNLYKDNIKIPLTNLKLHNDDKVLERLMPLIQAYDSNGRVKNIYNDLLNGEIFNEEQTKSALAIIINLLKVKDKDFKLSNIFEDIFYKKGIFSNNDFRDSTLKSIFKFISEAKAQINNFSECINIYNKGLEFSEAGTYVENRSLIIEGYFLTCADNLLEELKNNPNSQELNINCKVFIENLYKLALKLSGYYSSNNVDILKNKALSLCVYLNNLDDNKNFIEKYMDPRGVEYTGQVDKDAIRFVIEGKSLYSWLDLFAICTNTEAKDIQPEKLNNVRGLFLSLIKDNKINQDLLKNIYIKFIQRDGILSQNNKFTQDLKSQLIAYIKRSPQSFNFILNELIKENSVYSNDNMQEIILDLIDKSEECITILLNNISKNPNDNIYKSMLEKTIDRNFEEVIKIIFLNKDQNSSNYFINNINQPNIKLIYESIITNLDDIIKSNGKPENQNSKQQRIMSLRKFMNASNSNDKQIYNEQIFSRIKELGNKGSSKLTRSQIYAWVVVYIKFNSIEEAKKLNIDTLNNFLNTNFKEFNNNQNFNIKNVNTYFKEIKKQISDNKQHYTNSGGIFKLEQYDLYELVYSKILDPNKNLSVMFAQDTIKDLFHYEPNLPNTSSKTWKDYMTKLKASLIELYKQESREREVYLILESETNQPNTFDPNFIKVLQKSHIKPINKLSLKS